MGEDASSELQGAGSQLIRGPSSGKQEYDVDDTLDPIGRPVKKLEADIQCAGEAEYVDDIAPQPDELFAAYVYTAQANCTLETVDVTEAMVKYHYLLNYILFSPFVN